MADSAHQWPALLSLAVHELRSPATVISGYIKMLLRGHGGTLTATQREALQQAEQSCDRFVELLAGMSDFARLHGGRATLASDRVDLSVLLSEAAASVAARARPVVSVGGPAAADRGRPWWRIGPRLARAIAAIAAMIARADDVETVVAAGELVGDRVVITLSSAPERVTPATLEHLGPFNEFTGGLGLSLPLARFVVESAGGQLHALVTPGASGHRAAIVLPASSPDPQD